MRARTRFAALASLTLTACPPAAPGETTASATTSTASTGATPSTSTGPDPTSTSSSTTATGVPPASICDPQPKDVRADFEIDDGAFDEIEYSHHCTVAEVDQGQVLTIALAGCKADPDDPLEQPASHTITTTLFPWTEIDLAVGEPVVLSYVVHNPWWSNRAFTLRRPTDELMLAGLRGSSLPGESFGPPTGFFAPLSVTLIDACPTEPSVDDPGCNFVCNHCYALRRAVMRLGWTEGDDLELIDRSSQFWPDRPYWVVAGAAEFHDEIDCADTPDRWVRLVLLRHAS